MREQDYFGILQLLPAFLWLIIILVLAQIRRGKYGKEEGKYFMYNVLIKLFFSLTFVLFYIIVVQGGDTIAYYNGSVVLNNLMVENPGLYVDQLMTTPTNTSMVEYFNARTGYPPRWIYREPEGFFVSKIVSILGIVTFKSFIAVTFLISYFVACASYRMYALIRKMNLVKDHYLALGLLFLPSVNFWCTGVSKDSFVLIGVLMMIYHALQLISPENKRKVRSIVILTLMALLVFHIRPIILYVTIVSLAFAYTTYLAKRLSKNARRSILIIRSLAIIGAFVAFSQSLAGNSEQEFLAENQIFEEAAITQRDFANNELYGENKYSIGEIEFTPIGLVKAAPLAIAAGILRPFPWESLTPSLIFNGMESLLLISLLIMFLTGNLRAKIRMIQEQEILLFALTFVMVMSFVTGLTSGLFGVLVRLRAPLLPFVIMLLALRPPKANAKDSIALEEPIPKL
jgi:hypothetical protein